MPLFSVFWCCFKLGTLSWPLDKWTDTSLIPWLMSVCLGTGTRCFDGVSQWKPVRSTTQKRRVFSGCTFIRNSGLGTAPLSLLGCPPASPLSLSWLCPETPCFLACHPEVMVSGPSTHSGPTPHLSTGTSWHSITVFSQEVPSHSSASSRLTFLKGVLLPEALAKKIC